MQSKACLGYAEVQPAFDGTSKLELRSALRSACSLFYKNLFKIMVLQAYTCLHVVLSFIGKVKQAFG